MWGKLTVIIPFPPLFLGLIYAWFFPWVLSCCFLSLVLEVGHFEGYLCEHSFGLSLTIFDCPEFSLSLGVRSGTNCGDYNGGMVEARKWNEQEGWSYLSPMAVPSETQRSRCGGSGEQQRRADTVANGLLVNVWNSWMNKPENFVGTVTCLNRHQLVVH